MKKIFELWLDESGRFQDERMNKEKNFRPSLVGGILIEEAEAERIHFEELIEPDKIHAMELGRGEKSGYILPVLQRIQKEYGVRQVFFENLEYEEGESNRQLYLRIMAEGLLQLMLTLNAIYESVVLHVMIAQRQDVSAAQGQRRIQESEYQSALKLCMEEKKKERRIILDEDCFIDFDIKPAHRESKLQLADFACNIRLTQDCRELRQVRDEVEGLYENAFLFALSEVGSENYIKQCLTQGKIGEAFLELYRVEDRDRQEDCLEMILERMKSTSYRLQKSEMKQCASALLAYAAREENYRVGSAFLERLSREMIPALKAGGQIYESFHFTLLLQLSDMHLRAGNINQAALVLEECRQAQEALGNQMEEVFSYYQWMEKMAVLRINSFDYQSAADLMEEVCRCFQNIIHTIHADPLLKERFPMAKSEYYGDALCMQIYAMMFLQRKQPQLYDRLVQLSDEAMRQYPDREGELERHRQYRSHIEMEQGNYESALLWLLKAKLYEVKTVDETVIEQLLDRIYAEEGEVSCSYYLMYYLLIMAKAAQGGHPLADQMFRILARKEELLEFTEVMESEEQIYANTVDLASITESEDHRYHPREIIFWKLATYLREAGRIREALACYQKGIRSAFGEADDHTMRVTGLGILAEEIYCLDKAGKPAEALSELQKMSKEMENLQKSIQCPETLDFLHILQGHLKAAQNQPAEERMKHMLEIAESICY